MHAEVKVAGQEGRCEGEGRWMEGVGYHHSKK